MRALLISLVAATFSGCAAVPMSDVPRHLFADARFRPAAVPVTADDLFELSEPMRQFADNEVRRAIARSGTYFGMFNTLKDQLQLDYDASGSRPAAQTFELRAGNCISLVILTAAFARHLGMPVYYQSVVGQSTWTRSAGIAFHSGHVNLKVGSRENALPAGRGFDGLTIDFLASPTAASFSARPISEPTLIAMYLNNRAAEAVVEGDLDTAYWWSRAAIEADPTFLAATNTLGVIYLRHGDTREAEDAFRYTLLREPANAKAITNLMLLYTRLGREAEAAALRRRLVALEPFPPFYFLDQGQAALERGDAASALALFERELKRLPYNDEVHFGLALADYRLGDLTSARKHLALAERYSTTRDRRSLYSAKLAHFQARTGN